MNGRLSSQPMKMDVVWQMLQYIPSDDRKTWISAGMALKSEFGSDGFSLFDEWSKTSAKNKPKDATNAWRSFKSGPITIGTLIHIARENGWRPNSSNQPPTPKITTAPKQIRSSTQSYALKLWLTANKWVIGDNWLIDNTDTLVTSHPYAISRCIKSAGGAGRIIATGSVIGKNADCIIVPIRNIHTNKVQGVQCINGESDKQNFGVINGGALILGNDLDKSLPWYVCEGWASAFATVFHHQNGNGVAICAFGKPNLDNTARLIEQVHNPDVIRIQREQG